MLTNRDFYQWKNNPVTKEVFAVLEAEVKYNTELLTSGATLIQGREVAETAKIIGIIQGLKSILDVEVEGEVDESSPKIEAR